MDKRLLFGIANVFLVFLLIAAIVPTTTASPPVANFTSQEIGCYVVEFNGSASIDPDGTIVNHSWDFGTGESPRFVSDTGPPTTIAHTFASCGPKAVQLTVMDDEGNWDITTKAIRVSCEPVASFTSKDFGCIVEFNGSAMGFAGRSIANHSWDFGDGHHSGVMNGPPTTITHTYSTGGPMVVTLTVYDDLGCYDHHTEIIDVNCSCIPKAPVPLLSPLGLLALVGLLATIAFVTLVRKRH